MPGSEAFDCLDFQRRIELVDQLIAPLRPSEIVAREARLYEQRAIDEKSTGNKINSPLKRKKDSREDAQVQKDNGVARSGNRHNNQHEGKP